MDNLLVKDYLTTKFIASRESVLELSVSKSVGNQNELIADYLSTTPEASGQSILE